ncbi:hypothetical protein JW826_02385 [Candidatus Woesearchaeota archaeon]|nr:hypothetical protein [Candidatus Woesearchaeota archaeon]
MRTGSAAAVILTAAMLSLILSACASDKPCQTRDDCEGFALCVESKCVKVLPGGDGQAGQEPAAKEPVVENIELCGVEDADKECYRIRATKYADRNVCDYTTRKSGRSEMEVCYTCIISCK